ncbi:uncharacterized protein LOC133531852 [Cydia pomonella]|uniref:uncharacterized protein LOC133531852 n=1 Tax=Cydia pomonella TaxID=82600 RepID=UPI002ADE3E7C|nr:uncharacterized protein LOC133531852 [Cydia pomonella]
MEKENGEGSDAGKPPPDGLLDAAGLFGAYWGRDGAGGAAQAQAQAQAQAALFGFGGRYPTPQSSLGGHSQASFHPAASAAWWSMASHLAAQDYLARIQASGLGFGGPLGDPYSALSALSAKPGKGKPQQRNERSGRSSTSSSASTKEKSQSTGNSQPSMSEWGTSYGFPKTSSPSTMHSHSQAMSSLASLNSLASAPHQAKPSKHQPSQPRKSSSSSSSTTSSKGKERELALLRGDLMLAQAAAHGAYHAAVAAAAKGKNMSPLYPFGMPGSDKDRHGAIDSLTGLPHTILSAALEGGDPSSVLGGVRLPPDTEIIKYTSSLTGPKAPPGTTNRGRKKTISLDPPQVSVHPSTERGAPLPSKRQKVDDYGNSRSSVEVIRLPNKPDRAGHRTDSPANLADYAGISRELLQTIASQSGVSLAALERQLAGSTAAADSGLNLSTKSNNTSTEDSPLDLGLKTGGDEDAPLNLSLKPTPPSTQASDALSRLTSLSSSLNASSSNDRISRRKPGAKPRRVVPELNSQVADSPRPKSSGSEDSESVGWPNREGRPRNLGRGVSKPKKNTVASLLAQSRALGLRPALAQQLLAETDLEKLKALLGETASTDSECPSDSCPSDSDASESSRLHDSSYRLPLVRDYSLQEKMKALIGETASTDSECPSDSCPSDSDASESSRLHDSSYRLPLARSWKRITVIKGLSRNCNIKGDVTYTPPEPHQGMKIKSMQELQTFLDSNPQPPLTTEHFSFSARLVLGEYIQPAPELPEPLLFSEPEINKRLEEARALAALTGPRPTPPPVDRRIELARRQQAARDARRDASSRSRDQVTMFEVARALAALTGPRPTPPPVDRRIELARRQQAARDARRDASSRSRDQVTIGGSPGPSSADGPAAHPATCRPPHRAGAAPAGRARRAPGRQLALARPGHYVCLEEVARALAALTGPRPTPPPVDRRIELARRQQAARDARRDASSRSRDQVTISADGPAAHPATCRPPHRAGAAPAGRARRAPGRQLALARPGHYVCLEEVARALAALTGPRPTPPPVDRRIELARRQQAARDARRDASSRSRDQVTISADGPAAHPATCRPPHRAGAAPAGRARRAPGRQLALARPGHYVCLEEVARALAALTGPRPTPPPVDRRIELARRQQAARDARRDASSRSRDQVTMPRATRAGTPARARATRSLCLFRGGSPGASSADGPAAHPATCRPPHRAGAAPAGRARRAPGRQLALARPGHYVCLEEVARALAALTGPRPTPPPVDRRIELARRQQAARDARRDASSRSRDQARLVRELERTEKAELAKREKEARSAQLLEHINKNRTQLTIEPLPSIPKTDTEWKIPDLVMGPATKTSKDRTMPPISLSLIPVSGKDSQNIPIKLNLEQSWKDTIEYNALDKMKDFAEKAAFDLPKSSKQNFDFSLLKTQEKKTKTSDRENSLEKLIESYSRISEFINGCDWSKLQDKKDDTKTLEQKYIDAKNEFMSQNLMLMPKKTVKEVIDLSEDDELTELTKRINKGTINIGKDGELSISVHNFGKEVSAKRRKHEEIEKQKVEEQVKKQQDRELKRQQAMLLKEQQKYITEERERRRQHTTFIRQLDSRRRWEERERRKHQNLLDRLLAKEKKLQQRRKEMELLAELRRPQEDSTLSDQKPLPTLNRVPGLKLPGQAMADLLQAFEFIHNFGQTLGFDVDSIPSLNTLQAALLPACSPEVELELMQVLTHLLVCAIEDPGIPHPGRHTTLLGHALRMGDITEHNLSEVLRIYLYANATGEVKALTGLTAERERERRVADHHQTDAEIQQTVSTTKNGAYYEHLHNNNTYKLSEALRDKPFLALNATTKSAILAFLCNELLQNKSVLRQIDGALDHLNQLKKERYLMDMKIRKVRVLHQRKQRAEQSEKQQLLALERMQRLVEESTASLSRASPQSHEDEQATPEKDHKEDDKESTPDIAPSPYKEESDKELSPLKDNAKKELMNNNKEECSPQDNKVDKDSVMGDCDAILSDLESEGTQPEEDEDKNLSAEELSRKLEKLLRQSEQQLQQLAAGSHALRATCYGQDRYWRRYWSLGKCGGVFVEAMESAQPEIMDYHFALEETARRPAELRRVVKECKDIQADVATEALKKEEALKSELELKSIKSELNLSDHTQIIKYEPNVKHGACKVEGSIKMEEKYIQHKQMNEEEMLDIEDSIPTAFLVQKPTHTPMFAAQPEAVDKPQEIVKVENVVKKEVEKEEPEEQKDQLVNNLEELRKMAEAVSSQLDAAKKAEEIKEVKKEIKKEEIMEPDAAHSYLYTKMLEGKWFSILRHENSFLISEEKDQKVYCDNEHTCSEIIMSQGHKWDVSNNLHLLNDPSLFTLNSMVTSVQVPSNNVYADSSMSMSGLDQDMLDASKEGILGFWDVKEDSKEQDNDLEKELQADALKHDMASQKAKASSLTSLGLLNFNALSTYVTCDSPPPIQMTAEEMQQLDKCKVHGLPKKQGGAFVPRELRHGWWRITDPDQLKELIDSLHPRGAREKELHASLVQNTPTINNKLYIDKGDASCTELSITPLDRAIMASGGYPPPEPPGSFCAVTARRCDMQLLGMVEALEERVAAASMQIPGWRPARLALPEEASGAEIVARARHKLASLEANIERRYLKPPLVQRYASNSDASLGAARQGELGTASAPSPHDSDVDSKPETKSLARGLATWREAVARCNTSAQLAMLAAALEAATAWDKSVMKAYCQFCLLGDNEEQLLLCDGCDKGYHTYCFKPSMDKIPEGDWYCWVCVNKARGERVCIVCGGACPGRTIPCALCVRAYHHDCHYPPLPKNPRGKWYCSQCISRAPPKKPRNTKKKDSKHKEVNTSVDADQNMVPSPAPSHASTSTLAEDAAADAPPEPEREPAPPPPGELRHTPTPTPGRRTRPRRRWPRTRRPTRRPSPSASPRRRRQVSSATHPHPHPAVARVHVDAGRGRGGRRAARARARARAAAARAPPHTHTHTRPSHASTSTLAEDAAADAPPEPEREPAPPPPVPPDLPEDGPPPEKRRALQYVGGNGALQHEADGVDGIEPDAENVPLLSRAKKEKHNAKKLQKELQFCKNLLYEMECHEHAWPFLLPVNTKLFPQYKKVIKCPMDLSTIKKKLEDNTYKCKEEFASDVRLIFSNCEVFNEDYSPVGRAGHNMREFFDSRWAQA